MVCDEIRDKIRGKRRQAITTYRSNTNSNSWWENRVRYYFNVTRRDWQTAEKRINHYIVTSLWEVRPLLLDAGWDPAAKSAKYHYDFVMQEVANMTA